METLIRQAIKDDCQPLFHLYQEAGWASFTLDKISRLLNSSSYLVIEKSGDIIGFVRYLTDGVLTTFVSELFISQKYRGFGLGKQLLEAVQVQSPETRLELISEADDFYRSLGLRLVGTGFRWSKG